MSCKNCEESSNYIRVKNPNAEQVLCADCGRDITYKVRLTIPTTSALNWDKYFHSICNAVASKSSCLSRQIGAILVRDKSIISTGFNGPARGIPHCGKERFHMDTNLKLRIHKEVDPSPTYGEIDKKCPRKLLCIPSGEGMELCTAQHAEENCISNAARNGVSTLNSTLYLNTVIPCKNCFSTLINAGITEIVCVEDKLYDPYSKFIIENSSIKIRKFHV